MKSYVITWALSVLSACIIGAAWIYTHQPLKYAAVDVKKLVGDEVAKLQSALKPGMSPEEQQKAIMEASAVGNRLEVAINNLARECGCVVLNSAAIIGRPDRAALPDMTERARQLMVLR